MGRWKLSKIRIPSITNSHDLLIWSGTASETSIVVGNIGNVLQDGQNCVCFHFLLAIIVTELMRITGGLHFWTNETYFFYIDLIWPWRCWPKVIKFYEEEFYRAPIYPSNFAALAPMEAEIIRGLSAPFRMCDFQTSRTHVKTKVVEKTMHLV